MWWENRVIWKMQTVKKRLFVIKPLNIAAVKLCNMGLQSQLPVNS